MTGKADFTEEEWELVREGPPTAGVVALSASKGGSFGEAVALLEQKAGPGEVSGYKHFTLDVAARAAEAHKEKGAMASVSAAEREAIEKIAASLNPSPT